MTKVNGDGNFNVNLNFNCQLKQLCIMHYELCTKLSSSTRHYLSHSPLAVSLNHWYYDFLVGAVAIAEDEEDIGSMERIVQF